MELIIPDCEMLKELEDKENIILPFKLDLIERLYSDDYSFSDEEFLILADQLNYLDCNRLEDIILIIKYKNICLFSLNNDLQNRIKSIHPYDNIFHIFAKKNKLAIIKWLYHISNKRNL